MRRRALTGTPASMNWILQFDRVVLDWISNGDRKQEAKFAQLEFHFSQLNLTKKCKHRLINQCSIYCFCLPELVYTL